MQVFLNVIFNFNRMILISQFNDQRFFDFFILSIIDGSITLTIKQSYATLIDLILLLDILRRDSIIVNIVSQHFSKRVHVGALGLRSSFAKGELLLGFIRL